MPLGEKKKKPYKNRRLLEELSLEGLLEIAEQLAHLGYYYPDFPLGVKEMWK